MKYGLLLLALLVGCASNIRTKTPDEFKAVAAGNIKFMARIPLDKAYKIIVDKERACSANMISLGAPRTQVWADLYEKSGRGSVTAGLFSSAGTGTGGIFLHSELSAVGDETQVIIYYVTEAWEKRARFRKDWLIENGAECGY
jgi:hypothetical protein